MHAVSAAADAAVAQWLLDTGVDWGTLVRFGPPVYDVYVRIPFASTQRRDDDLDMVRLALDALAGHTRSEHGFAAVWEGWCGEPPPTAAPLLAIPHRPMYVYTGPLEALRDAAALAWESPGSRAEPHLVWPDDRRWLLVCDVDEEVEFTVGCTADTAAALAQALPTAVRTVQYGENAPLLKK